jgi:hypothetical protein
MRVLNDALRRGNTALICFLLLMTTKVIGKNTCYLNAGGSKTVRELLLSRLLLDRDSQHCYLHSLLTRYSRSTSALN